MASRTTTAPPRIVRTVARQASLGDASADTPSSRPGSSARMAEAKPSELQDIWRRYKSSGGQDLRDRLILTYAPLVKYVAGRLGTGLPAHVEEGDLISYGLLGLIGAIERYELDRDVKFETYAIARIKGSITDEVLAAEIGISESDLQDSLTSISRSSIAALDELWTISSTGGDTVSLIDTIEDPNADDPSKALDRIQVKAALGEAIQRLPERERLVVSLYYYEELTLREIGEVLGVTESRVSQLHTKAILRLKVRLQGSLERAALER